MSGGLLYWITYDGWLSYYGGGLCRYSKSHQMWLILSSKIDESIAKIRQHDVTAIDESSIAQSIKWKEDNYN